MAKADAEEAHGFVCDACANKRLHVAARAGASKCYNNAPPPGGCAARSVGARSRYRERCRFSFEESALENEGWLNYRIH
jgi:hypothetical protein